MAGSSGKTITFRQFLRFIGDISGERPECMRFGQWAFNTFAFQFPDIAHNVVATDLDPFFVDEKVPAFLSWILSNHVTMDEQ